MSDLLRVAAVQLAIVDGDKESTLEAMREAIELLPAGTDVAVLPEMFNTGFVCDAGKARELAEPVNGESMNLVRELARRHNVAVCGSIIVSDDGKLYNRAFFVEPTGDEYYYDKRHLFSPGGEDKVYERGQAPMPVIRYRGWNIALAVCFDLRFPAWLRNAGARYDLLTVVANWPDSREYAWRQLLVARAIENQCYVVGCNRRGSDNTASYSGCSVIVEPKGHTVGTVDDLATLYAELSRSSLRHFREKFPVLDEADDINISF